MTYRSIENKKLLSRSCGGILDLTSHIVSFISLHIVSLGHFCKSKLVLGANKFSALLMLVYGGSFDMVIGTLTVSSMESIWE